MKLAGMRDLYRRMPRTPELSDREIDGLREHVRRLARTHRDGAVLSDTLVLAGTPQRPHAQQSLRLIRWRRGKKSLRLLTNVLDPAQLPAASALALFRRRWKVERMFYDLKQVLDLHRFYAGNVNAVAMQVHAAALVYVALRIAQGRIARKLGLRPERLSTEKLFPRVAAASQALVDSRRGYFATCRANPAVRLVEPDWSEEDFASTRVDVVLVETRSPRRRRRPRRRDPGTWKSLHALATKPRLT